MKKIFTLSFTLIITILSFSQNKAAELYNLGNTNFKLGKYDEAILNFTELIALTDKPLIKKTGFINRGLSYDKINKYDLAISDFTIAIELDSTDLASFTDRGLSNMHANNLKKAKEDFNYVIAENTNHKMSEAALYWSARINSHEGNYKEVITNCDDYLKINASDPEIYFIRGTANDMLFNSKEAILDYDSAIAISSDYYQALANRGVAKINLLRKNGKIKLSEEEKKSACEDLNRAKELGDDSVDDLIYVHCNSKK
ncbi:tetratricopeptide repeat protein [Flavobacterium sp.]|uniref:tetratricopeptide repeat protein n=1 Tax=Flavobacterium sp. TaxID=239 RepID=UPI004048D7C1